MKPFRIGKFAIDLVRDSQFLMFPAYRRFDYTDDSGKKILLTHWCLFCFGRGIIIGKIHI